MNHIETYYPKAQNLSSLWVTIKEELEQRGMDPSKCIWGTSFCSEEVNNSFNAYNSHFMGEGPFRFGGLSGIPFTGTTGFSLFSNHIPENGGAVILYGPHIGITSDGKPGNINREGQAESSACCASIVKGLESAKVKEVLNMSYKDYQQALVQKLMIENLDAIKQSDKEIIKATDIAYTEINKQIKRIVETKQQVSAGKPILLIGGIVINTDWKEEDAFEIRDVSLFTD